MPSANQKKKYNEGFEIKKGPSANSPQSAQKMHSFDPTKNKHLWTMWRIAVNERIFKETQHREHHGVQPDDRYADALTKAPLSHYIRVTETTRKQAHDMMATNHLRMGGSQLHTGQFIYYGLPRVDLSRDRNRSERSWR